jgi:hypothetical protein
MANKTIDGAELFLKMWAAWESTVPRVLVHEDPGVLIRFLDLSTTPQGISQLESKRALGIKHQPRLTKLTKKLEDVKWIKVATPKEDRRKRLTITTATGKEGLAALRSKLGALASAPSASPRTKPTPKGIRPVAGKTSFDLDKYL